MQQRQRPFNFQTAEAGNICLLGTAQPAHVSLGRLTSSSGWQADTHTIQGSRQLHRSSVCVTCACTLVCLCVALTCTSHMDNAVR